METRWVIERYAIERAAPALGAELAALADAGEGEDFVEADRAFHRALVASTGNAILLSLYDTLRDRQRRMLRVSARTDERKATIVAEHRELAKAIADGGDATAILRRHLDGALATLRGAGAHRPGRPDAPPSLRWSQEATREATNCSATRLVACSGVTRAVAAAVAARELGPDARDDLRVAVDRARRT